MASCAPSSWFLYRERCRRDRRQQHLQQLSSSGGGFLISSVSGGALGVSRSSSSSSSRGEKASRGEVKVGAFWQDVSRPTSPVQLEAIAGMEDLDRLLEQARGMDQAVVIDWMAAWCRKCIYLKPKLEKLAAEFYPRVKFYCVDVNKVPQALVKRGNISKMPTMQLWKDGECKEEVIGGHKAWLVVEEVREMVQKYL